MAWCRTLTDLQDLQAAVAEYAKLLESTDRAKDTSVEERVFVRSGMAWTCVFSGQVERSEEPSAGARHAVGGMTREHVDVDVARRDLAPGRAHPDLRLLKVLPRKPHRVQHCPAGRTLGSIQDQ